MNRRAFISLLASFPLLRGLFKSKEQWPPIGPPTKDDIIAARGIRVSPNEVHWDCPHCGYKMSRIGGPPNRQDFFGHCCRTVPQHCKGRAYVYIVPCTPDILKTNET